MHLKRIFININPANTVVNSLLDTRLHISELRNNSWKQILIFFWALASDKINKHHVLGPCVNISQIYDFYELLSEGGHAMSLTVQFYPLIN